MKLLGMSVIFFGVFLFSFGAAASDGTATPASPQQQYEQMVARAIAYLETKGQSADGSYSDFSGPGVTALATRALIEHGRAVSSPAVAKGIAYLEQHVQDDGGIYRAGSLYRNYETCLAITCLQAINDDGRYDEVLKRADAFVRGLQWDEGEGADQSEFAYGGAGYGRHKRPDLSNTSFFMDALKAMDHDASDPAIQRALVFISRCQNLESEHNRTPFATKNPDGGFYYTPAAGGTSQAGETPSGGLRSYGSMTYAGLKSMIFAGVGPEDPRVKAAVDWIRKHYDLQSNPGMGQAGLYYYYHTFAKALDAIGFDTFRDAEGVEHNWRHDLIETLAEHQREDGSWINDNERWLEGDPNLVTSYALLALVYCKDQSP